MRLCFWIMNEMNMLINEMGCNFPVPYCPECYVTIDKNIVHPCSYLNYNIESVKDEEKSKEKASHENQICKSCVREARAHKWCVECQEFLCEFCCEVNGQEDCDCYVWSC